MILLSESSYDSVAIASPFNNSLMQFVRNYDTLENIGTNVRKFSLSWTAFWDKFFSFSGKLVNDGI